MGLFGFLKKAVDVVTFPFATAGAIVGGVGATLLDGAGQGIFWGVDHLFGGHYKFSKKQLFEASAIGGTLGEALGGFGSKFFLSGGLAVAGGLLLGGLSMSNSFTKNDVLNPALGFEAKALGLTAGSGAGQATTVICGPTAPGPDGKPYQGVAVPLPPGAVPSTTVPPKRDPQTGEIIETFDVTGQDGQVHQVGVPVPPDMLPTGQTKTDTKTGTTYELYAVPPGSCKDGQLSLPSVNKGIANSLPSGH